MVGMRSCASGVARPKKGAKVRNVEASKKEPQPRKCKSAYAERQEEASSRAAPDARERIPTGAGDETVGPIISPMHTNGGRLGQEWSSVAVWQLPDHYRLCSLSRGYWIIFENTAGQKAGVPLSAGLPSSQPKKWKEVVVMPSHPEAVAKVIEAPATRSLTSSATPRPGPEGGPGPAQLLFANQERRPLGRHFPTYLRQMRGSSLELRGDSRNVRNCCICVVALSRKTEQVVLVHRLLNPLGFAVGQLAVFQGASEAPLSGS